MQQSIEQAHQEGRLELDKWAANIIKRIKMSYKVQHIWNGEDGNGPYKDYYVINNARSGKYRSTGASYNSIYKMVTKGANGDTAAVDFFFKRYLLFVDWGVGIHQKTSQVPNPGVPKMTKRYATWSYRGDRQRRPVVIGGIRGGMFGALRILKAYWGKETQLAILAGFGYNKDGKYQEQFGGLQDGLDVKFSQL